jgi:mono/diheme cytochrome c family protein
MSEQKEDPSSENENFQFDRSDLEDNEVQKIHSQHRREKGEPTEGYAVPPMALIFLCMVLCIWAGLEIERSSAGFRWDAYSPKDGAYAEVKAPKVYDPIARGKRVYNKCISCHQANGQGLPGIYPPLAGSDWMGKSPDILVRIIHNGLNGPIVVNGNTYNNVMTGFSDLSDKEIAEVLSYIRNTWGNSYPIITEEEVALIDDAIGDRTSPYTAQELLDLFE